MQEVVSVNVDVFIHSTGCQHVKAPLAAAISPSFDFTHPPKPRMNVKDMKSEIEIDHHTADYVP